MRRLPQHTWFCLAAVWLAGSLSMYWALEIDVAPEDLKRPPELSRQQVIRRIQDLESITAQPQYLTGERSRRTRRPTVSSRLPESPAVPSHPGVVRLSDTVPAPFPRPEVAQTGYQADHQATGPAPAAVPRKPSVWFRGEIELVK